MNEKSTGRMTRVSYPAPSMTSPQPHATEPNGRRLDIRAAVLPLVLRLTDRLLNPGAGVASRDSYVLNVRKAIGKGQACPVQMIVAIAYDDVVNKGRPAAEVRSWLLELVEEIDCWDQERLGQRLSPPSLRPVLVRENRVEGQENEAALTLDENCPASLEKLIQASEAEIDVTQDLVALARRRMVSLQRGGIA